MDPSEAIQAMYLAFFTSSSSLNIREMKKKMDILDETVIKHENYIVELEDKVIRMEVEQYENKITLKHIPTSNTTDKEMLVVIITIRLLNLNNLYYFGCGWS